MYRCQITNRFSERGAKLNKVVTQIAMRTYHAMVRDEETRRMIKIEIGRGFEIVKEINASDEGVRIWNEKNPNGPEVVDRNKVK